MNIRDLLVETAPVSSLSPYANNPRTHTRRQIDQIAMSIQTFGWTNPILVDREGGIIAGHGRFEAAKMLGIESVPTIRLENLTPAQKRAYVIADNRLAENAGWDEGLLRLEIGALLEFDLDLDVEAIGFEVGEVDQLLATPAAPEAETAPACEPGPAVSRLGDVWRLGRHRLACADAQDAETYTRLLEGRRADAVFCDPPWNLPIDGHVGGLGKISHPEFVMASGEMSPEEFETFLKTVCERLSAAVKPGGICFVCIDWRSLAMLIQTGKTAIGELKNICVWAKDAPGMGSFYRSQHEMVAVFCNAGGRPRNNVQLGKFGRNRSNVWAYPGVLSRRDELALHPTAKPVAMVADAILDVTARGETVLDPFGGSGATLLAAEQTGRRAVCADLDPRYVDVIVRRFEEATGEPAVMAESGQTFDAVRAVRQASGSEGV